MNNESTVIISFYNKIEILKLVLSGFERQSVKNFEIIIADDGSDEKVVQEIKQLIQASSLLIRHIWHTKKGWQKNGILNKAIVASRTDYLIFSDGDCIPHRHFVKEHFLSRQKITVLTGRRVLLSEKVSRHLTINKVRSGHLEYILFPWMIFERILGKGQFIEDGLYFRNKWIRKFINTKKKGLLGSNFSIYKSDILAINGFDERYQSPYIGEDTDLEFRLRLNGCKFRHLKHMAIQYHCYHQRMAFSHENHHILNNNKQRNTGYTPYGINQVESPQPL